MLHCCWCIHCINKKISLLQNQGIQRVLQIMNASKDKYVHCEGRECLALLGHIAPVAGNGLRILSIDGGGIRLVFKHNYHFIE